MSKNAWPSALAVLLLAGATGAAAAPAYTAAGELIPPADYREWVYMSTGIGMAYTEGLSAMVMSSMFDNVFVDPASWAEFKKTGHWPDKTMFVLEVRGSGSKASINKKGHFQTEGVMGVEAHVRDDARFKGGWGFFALGSSGKPAKQLGYEAECYSCHQQHGAVDTTFTQFYPTAKPIAVKAGTYAEK
jgi:hypothetical protein